jgi:hypothetical protein
VEGARGGELVLHQDTAPGPYGDVEDEDIVETRVIAEYRLCW